MRMFRAFRRQVKRIARDNYQREEFATSAERNERHAELRRRLKHVVKYSTQRDQHSVFIVAWPKSAESVL